MEKSMWRKIREDVGLKQNDIIKATGLHKQTVSAFEKGKRKSYKLQAYYLRLRGFKEDLILANYFEEEVENANIRNK